eukprot:g12739.t1
MDSSERHEEGRLGGLPGENGQNGILRQQPNANGSSPPTRQAGDDDETCIGWAAKLYQDFVISSGTWEIAGGATISPTVAAQEPGKAAMGAAWKKAPADADAPPRRWGANTRPTAALVAAACRNRARSLLPAAGAPPPADAKLAPRRSSSRLIGRTRCASTIRATTENPPKKRRCVDRRSAKQDEDKLAKLATPAPAPAIGIASKVSPVPVMAVDPSTGSSENAEAQAARMATPTSEGGVEPGGGASTQRTVEGGRKAVSIAHSTKPIPEYDIYSSSNKSVQAECKRNALLDLATADMDLVNLERDFQNKDAGFNDAKKAHNTLHKRWVISTMTLEASCNASGVYFEEVDRARQKHEAACRDRQAAEARVREALAKSALAQTTLRTAKETFYAARQEAAAYFKRNAATVAVKSSGTCDVGIGGRRDDDDDDDPGSSSLPGTSGNGRKKSPHCGADGGEIPSFATVPTCTATADRDNTAKAKHVGGGGSRSGDGWSQEEMHQLAKSRSTMEVSALSEQDEERHSHSRGLQAPHEILAGAALQATDDDDAVAEGSTPAFSNSGDTPPAHDPGFEAATSALAVAVRNMKDAIASANRASADLNASKGALDLSGVVRTEAETAVAHRNAVNNAGPYVCWVNSEVARQRNLSTWTKELVGAASRAWDAREEAREELKRAEGRKAMARRALRSFSRGDEVDTSRHALFKFVAEDRRQREMIQPSGVGWANSVGGGGGYGAAGSTLRPGGAPPVHRR